MRGMWLCEGWAVPRWLATMVPAWVGSTGWNLVPAWYLLLYLLLLLRLLLPTYSPEPPETPEPHDMCVASRPAALCWWQKS